jgi:hypothetical protein
LGTVTDLYSDKLKRVALALKEMMITTSSVLTDLLSGATPVGPHRQSMY